MSPAATTRRHWAIGLISSSLLAIQIVLMQLLATSQWYHFAYLVISIALLGFGVAGSILAIGRSWLLPRIATLLPLLLSATALALIAPLGLSQALFGGFDSYLVFVNIKEALKLVAASLLLMLPFVCGSLAIGLVFTDETQRIGSYYFANLLGSGCGSVLGLLGLEYFTPNLLPPYCAVLALLAAILVIKPGQQPVRVWILAITGVILWSLVKPPDLVLSQYKGLERVRTIPGASIIAQQPSAAGQLHVVTAPSFRTAPGISLRWSGEIPSTPVVFINGDAIGSLPLPMSPNNPLNATTSALPYALTKPQRILILGAGTGAEVSVALQHGATEVTAVEPFPRMSRILAEVAPQTFGRILADPRTRWQTMAPRTWLEQDSNHYDLVLLPTIGSFGGDSGLFALQEQPMLTRQALTLAWHHLNPDGILAITTWLDYPVRKPLRLFATLLEAMDDVGIHNPEAHLVAIRSWGTLTFCLKRSPLTSPELAAVRDFNREWSFDPVLLPGLQNTEREQHHRLQDNSLFSLLDTLMTERRDDLYQIYPFRIRPPTDDRPFFSQFLRWRHLDQLLELYGEQNLPFLETGLLVAALAAAILSTLAILLILLPLLRLPHASTSTKRLATILYFGGLGIGYMWIELGLIHEYILYLGQPVLAAALVIGVLLVGSGVGSVLSSRCTPVNCGRWAGSIAVMITGYALLLGPLLSLTQTLPDPMRLTTGVLILLPPAFLMGFPFPLGLRQLDLARPAEVPWAWGINGCLSVAGAAVATLIAVEIGFTALLFCAAAAYLLPAAARLS